MINRISNVFSFCFAVIAVVSLSGSALAQHLPGENNCETPPSSCGGCGCSDLGGPGEGGKGPQETVGPIRMVLNGVVESSVDVSVPGAEFGWSHTRRYNSRESKNPLHGVTAPEGERWHGDATGQYIVRSVSRFRLPQLQLHLQAGVYRRFTQATPTTYNGPANSDLTLTIAGSGASEEFTIVNSRTGNVYVFFGLDAGVNRYRRGKLKARTSRTRQAQTNLFGNVYDYVLTGGAAGLLDHVITSQGWRVQYEYLASGPNANKLQSVSVHQGGTTSATLLQRAEYTYFNQQNSDVGYPGDLIQAKIYKRASFDSGSNLTIVRTTQYRYFNSGRHRHQIKSVFESDAIERLLATQQVTDQNDDGAIDSNDLLELSDASQLNGLNLESYASRSFTHYDSGVVPSTTDWGTENLRSKYGGSKLTFQADSAEYWGGATKSERITGSCSSCGGGVSGGITKKYYYTQLAEWYDGFSQGGQGAGANEPSRVVRIVIEDTLDTDGTPQYRDIYGVNYYGTALRTVHLSDPLNPSADNIWCTSIVLDADQRVKEQRMASVHHGKVTDNASIKKFLNPLTDGNNDNDTDTSHADAGEVYHYQYTDKRITGKLISQGTGGPKHYVSATDYSTGYGIKFPVATHTYPQQTTSRTDPSRQTTSFDYTFWSSSDPAAVDTAVKQITTTHPAVATSENGSGVPTVTYVYFDQEGRKRWTKDGDGYVNYYSYHPTYGSQVVNIIDIDTSNLTGTVTSGNSSKIGWSSGVPSDLQRGSDLPPALGLQTQKYLDSSGRLFVLQGPSGQYHIQTYFSNGTAKFPFYQGGIPVEIQRFNDGDVLLESFTVKPTTMSHTSTSLPTNLNDYVTRTEYVYDAVTGQSTESRRYHDITGNGYHSQHTFYDKLGRRAGSAQSIDGTKFQVSIQKLDTRGRNVETHRGVLSGLPTDYTQTLDVLSDANKVSAASYDVDDRMIDKTVYHESSSNFTKTTYHRTYRGHVRGVERQYSETGTPADVKPYQALDLDWMGRTKVSAGYTTEPDWSTLTSGYASWVDGAGTSGRFNLVKDFYDRRNQLYRVERYPHTESTKHTQTNRYYDRRGNLVCSGDVNGAHSEVAFDGAGRQYQQRLVADVNSTTYSGGQFGYNKPAPHPTFELMEDGDEGVIELSHTQFDRDLVIGRYRVELNHDETNGFSLTGGNVGGGIRSTTYYWHDRANRVTDMANYGSGDGTDVNGTILAESTFKTRPGIRPSWTDDAVFEGHQLVTKYGYHPNTGRRETVTIGVRELDDNTVTQTTKTFHDDLNRARFVVENWQADYDPTSAIGNVTAGVNRTTETKYNGLSRAVERVAYNDSTAHQSTKYLYNDPVSATRVTETIFPDSDDTDESGSDQIKRTFNRDGSLATLTDQRSVVHTYNYNERRQVLLDAATLAAGVDDRVQAIGRSYDEFGRTTKITSYGGITNDSPVRNEIAYDYHAEHGRLEATGQDHAGAVDGDSHETRYVYDQEADGDNAYENSLRLVETFYPVVPGAKNELDYSTATSGTRSTWFGTNRLDDRLNRVSFQALSDGELRPGNNFHSLIYNYSGSRRLVFIASSHFGAGAGRRGTVTNLQHYNGSGNYNGFDRFGRPVKQDWRSFRTGPSAAHTERSYDYASNLIERRDPLAASVTAAAGAPLNLDRTYGYDGLFRMQSSDKAGTANDQSWKLDQLGNQLEIFRGDNPDPETRTYTAANELDTSTRSRIGAGAPEHDAAGNMTNVPYPTLPNYTLHAKYDAWNRLVDYSIDNFNTSYQYDSLHRRIERTFDDYTTHFYYNENWQVLTETDGNDNATAIYNYHPHYVDAVAVRMRSQAASGVVGGDEHFFLHDHQFNVIAAVDEATNQVVERYRYSARGERTVMDANFRTIPRGALDFNVGLGVEYAYTGARLDPTGLQLHRYRYYHPGLGQWINRDPAGYVDGMSQYRAYFVPGAVDPWGLDKFNMFDEDERKAQQKGAAVACKLGAEMAVTMIPGVGEGGDVEVLTNPKSTTNERCIAGASLGVSVVTLGTSPNFGRPGRAVGEICEKLPAPKRARHHTDNAGARGIGKDGAINPSRDDGLNGPGVDVEVEPFGPTKPGLNGPKADTGSAAEGAFVEFDLPENAVPTPWVGPRNTARIPTDEPLPIGPLNPEIVERPWWKIW